MKIKTKTFLLLSSILIIFFISSIKSLALYVGTGLTVLPSPTDIFNVVVQWAIPEKRVGVPGTNDDTLFYITIRNPVSHDILYIQPELLSTDTEGKYLVEIPTKGFLGGDYDIGFKGASHLTKVLRGANLSGSTFVANFTNDFPSSTRGLARLIAGDINGDGLTPSTLGDDVINSVDLSVLIGSLDAEDPTSRYYRANLNQDTSVNSVDLSLLLSNIDKEGER